MICRASRALGPTALAALILPASGAAQNADVLTAPYSEDACPPCAGWNEPQAPFRVFGDTYYVGTRGLASLLIASPEGHILIDGGLPDSAPHILENVRALGFDVADVRLILISHAHYDHAGGVAALERASGARVAALPAAAAVLERGRIGPDDPQHGVALDFPAVPAVERIENGQTLRVGPLAVTAHRTAGHTPGGTSWSWESCEEGRCLHLVYADSQTPVSADGFRFTDSPAYPTAIADFERGFAALEALPCDILVTPHPGASSFWERMAEVREGLVDAGACEAYIAAARERLARRLEAEAMER